MKLNELKIRKLTAAGKHVPGKHSDGGGLYIELTEAGSSYWRLKYRFAGKEKRLAFGVYPTVGLKDAREKREAAKKVLARGEDPGEVRKVEKPIGYVVLDFGAVPGLDTSAVLSLIKLRNYCNEHSVTLAFSGLSEAMRASFRTTTSAWSTCSSIRWRAP